MKKFMLKSAVLAIAALAGSAAFAAAVNLDTSPVAIKYAKEQTFTTNIALRDGAAADQQATTTLGASFGTDVTAYVRVDVTGGTFNGTPVAGMFAVQDSGPAAATVSVAQIGAGNAYVIFAVTPSSTRNLVGANVATIDTDVGTATGILVTAQTGVTLQYRLFETLTAAANPATNNTLKDKSASYATFVNALSTTVTALSAVADVGAAPSYTAFTGGGTKAVAKVATAVDGAVALASGAAATAAGLLTATSDLTFTGDFTLVVNDDATYTGSALTRVFLAGTAICGGGTVNATTVSATTATFTDESAANLVRDQWLCLTPEGTPEIAVGSYTVAINYEPQSGFAITDLSGVGAGSVSRNGVRMVAPLAQMPTGWISRLVLTNTGTSVRQYTVSAVSETGTTVVLSGGAAAGALAAGKTTVVDLPASVTISGGAPRTSLVVTVNAPQSEIDGLYQIVSPAGGLSNMLLSYKN